MVCEEGLTAHNAFVARTREKWEFNQYWYSAHTIKVMAKVWVLSFLKPKPLSLELNLYLASIIVLV